MNIQTVTSPGGITAWLVETHAVPMLALRFAFDGGSTQDPAGKEGRANFVAQMLDEGAGDFSGLAFQERAKDLGVRLGFRAGGDTFSGSLDVLSESRDEALALLRMALMAPHFDGEATERVRQRLKVGISRAARDPDKAAGAQWDTVAFMGHPYARPLAGTLPSVGAITADDLEFCRRHTLARDTLKVVAVGDITPDDLGRLLDATFGGLPAAATLTHVPPVRSLPAGRLAVVDMDVPQSAVVFGMAGIAQHDPDYIAAVVVNHIVGGGGFSSRLMEEVRVKRGLAYGVSSGLFTARHAPVWRGSVATRNDLVQRSLDVIRDELGKVAAGEIGESDLQSAKGYLIGSYPLRFDSNGKIASQLMGLRVDGYGPQYVSSRNALVAAVTLEDLKRVAQRLFTPDNLIVAIAGKPLLQAARDFPSQIATSAA